MAMVNNYHQELVIVTMKSSNAELVAQLEEATAGLLFPTENYYCFKTFVWEVAEELTLEKLLQSAGIVKRVEIDDFLQFISLAEAIATESKNKYVNLFKILQKSLESIEILRISISGETEDLGEYETFYLIIGKTQAGDWIGISPKIDAESSARRSDILLLDSSVLVRENTLALVTELENMLPGLEFPVVQYYVKDKIENFLIETAENRELLIDKILHSLEFVKTCAFKKFSDYYSPIRDEDEEVDFEKVKRLDRILQSNLTNIREYVIGGMAIYYLYDIGQTQGGDWIGVSTIAIWT